MATTALQSTGDLTINSARVRFTDQPYCIAFREEDDLKISSPRVRFTDQPYRIALWEEVERIDLAKLIMLHLKV